MQKTKGERQQRGLDVGLHRSPLSILFTGESRNEMIDYGLISVIRNSGLLRDYAEWVMGHMDSEEYSWLCVTDFLLIQLTFTLGNVGSNGKTVCWRSHSSGTQGR